MPILERTTASGLLENWLKYDKLHAHEVETVGRIGEGKGFRWFRGDNGWHLALAGGSNHPIGQQVIDEVLDAIEGGSFSIRAFDLKMTLEMTLFSAEPANDRARQNAQHQGSEAQMNKQEAELCM